MGKIYNCVHKCCKLLVCSECLNLLLLILLNVYVKNDGAINNNIDKQNVSKRCICNLGLACTSAVANLV